MGGRATPCGVVIGLGQDDEGGECQRPLCGICRGVGDRNVGKCLGKGTGIRFNAGYGGAVIHPREGAGIHSGGGSSQGGWLWGYICGEPGQASTAEGGTREG